jgi:hypothetical protein
MAIQSSGPISFQDLQDEYGGGHPINIAEYYKNGAYVPSSITEYYNYQYGIYSASAQTYWYTDSDTGTSGMYLNGVNWRTNGSYNNTQFLSGTRTYIRATYQGAYYQFKFYSYNTYDITNSSVNQNVPTSGAISLSNFYGGRKT